PRTWTTARRPPANPPHRVSVGGRRSGGSAGVVAAVDLVDGVFEYGGEHGEAVPDASAGAGQVDDEGVARLSGETAGEDGGGHLVAVGGADGLGDAGDLAGDDAGGHLRGEVGGGEAGAAGRHDHVVLLGDAVAEGGLDGFAVGDDDGPVDGAADLREAGNQDRSRFIGINPGGRPVRHRHHQRPYHDRLHSPVFPPVFSSTRMSVMTASGSTALTMSNSASAAVDTAVSASISTPVRSAVLTRAVTATPQSATSSVTLTPWMAIGWQSGIR